MNPNGAERRKILQNGIEASVFDGMSGSEQNWHLYSQIQTLAGAFENFVYNDFSPAKTDIGMLKRFRFRLLVGIGMASAFLCGLGVIEYKSVLKYVAKLVL